VGLGPYSLIDIEYLKRLAHDVALPDDDVLEDLINQATQIAETKTGRKLKARDCTVTLDGPGGDVLLLPEYPVNSVSTVHLDPDRQFGGETEITDYYLETAAGLLHYDAGWGSAPQSVRVTLNAGLEPVPEDLKECVVELVIWLIPRQRAGVAGQRTIMDAAGLQTELEISMPLHVQRVLGVDYKRTR
jgi:hypothetical protein